ncbi:DotU family type IV/VI secretion system protein [Neisseria dumasiana]|uniref:Type IV secretion protein DotU n=1 Tax=Neisseria dumasiana TaxID=1931275 RepID=A0A1X3DH94_9NEIS|nr:DotU family type IV/VI secretion system protein [Neisseria dumasiana]OSI19145.1 type IV secretion protein DotU [Neisseria dumasiana]
MNNQFLIRSSLRDTAIAVATLSSGATPETAATWHEYGKTLVTQFKNHLHEHGFSSEEIDALSYAQCALLDEMALKHLQGQDRDVWEMEPLQVHFFQSYHAGDVLCDRIEKLCSEKTPDSKIAEGYLSILNLGFRGRYVLDEQEAQKWRNELSRFVPKPAYSADTSDGHFFYSDYKGTLLKKGFSFNLGWVFACLLAITVVTYFIYDFYLSNLAQQITTK